MSLPTIPSRRLVVALSISASMSLALSPTGVGAQDSEADADAAEGDAPAERPARRRSRQDAEADPPRAFILEGGMRIDMQELTRRSEVNRIVTRDSDSARELGGMIYLGFLSGLSETVMIGAGFGFGGQTSVGDGDDAIVLGQQLLIDVRMQLNVPIQPKLDIIMLPRVGATVLTPQGELDDIIGTSRNQGYNTWRGPRVGLLVGADAGVRYMVNDWLGLRGTVGYAYLWSPLLRSSAESSFATASRDWTYTAHRLRIAFGLEAQF